MYCAGSGGVRGENFQRRLVEKVEGVVVAASCCEVVHCLLGARAMCFSHCQDGCAQGSEWCFSLNWVPPPWAGLASPISNWAAFVSLYDHNVFLRDCPWSRDVVSWPVSGEARPPCCQRRQRYDEGFRRFLHKFPCPSGVLWYACVPCVLVVACCSIHFSDEWEVSVQCSGGRGVGKARLAQGVARVQ